MRLAACVNSPANIKYNVMFEEIPMHEEIPRSNKI